ncbi:hypothetical protein C0993_006050 [Termitomyces sp. T159_Od127]|nr:hypothetical protein C0993_006050 [Termitomyces sp. T159_Od127]
MVTYQLKMKNSQAMFLEVQKKGTFSFNICSFKNKKHACMGLQEAVQHSLIKPYKVIFAPANTFVTSF